MVNFRLFFFNSAKNVGIRCQFFRHFFRLLLELNGVAKGEVTELRRRVGRQPDLEKPRSSLGLMGVPEMGGYPEMDGLEWKKSIQMDENEG